MFPASRRAGAANQIATGATFEGTLRFSGCLQVDGTVLGTVIADPLDGSEVVVGVNGRVEGRISAATVLVSGTVQGPVHASVRLDVFAGAKLRSDIDYRDLQIQHGALVEGSLRSIGSDQVPLKLVANSRI